MFLLCAMSQRNVYALNYCLTLFCVFQNPAFEILIKGINKTENLKEKASCIKSLCTLKKRDYYGDSRRFQELWELLLNGLSIPETKVPCCYKTINKYLNDVSLSQIQDIG